MNRFHALLCGLLLLAATSAQATICVNAKGIPTDIYYDLSNLFASGNNHVGEVVTLPEKSGWVGVQAICPAGTKVNYTYRSYVSDLPIHIIDGGYKYMKLNDYLEGAMSITDDYAGIFFPPRNFIRMGTHPNVPNQKPFGVMDSKLIFKLKVVRPFINMVPIPRQTMFRVYVTSTDTDALAVPVYTISYSGKVEVPQSCKLNAGQVVEFEFDKIGAALFSQAGPGNRPNGVDPQIKTVAIECTNVDAQAYLSMRLEAEKVSGQVMVSDNPDVGFVVADREGNPLTPNMLGSKIPFQLDDNASARVDISAWPVSATGFKPAEGDFVARGYLRVDYD